MAESATSIDKVESPSATDASLHQSGTVAQNDSRGVKRPRTSTVADDDDDDDDGKPGRERRKIDIKFITDKSRRHITFSKRKAGIMKKAYELSVLTGTQVLLLVVSETGLVYTFTTPKLQPLVTKTEGKNLIQTCLNAPETSGTEHNGVDNDPVPDPQDDLAHLHSASQTQSLSRNQPIPAGYGLPNNLTPEQQQQMVYQQYMQQHQQQGPASAYPMPSQVM